MWALASVITEGCLVSVPAFWSTFKYLFYLSVSVRQQGQTGPLRHSPNLLGVLPCCSAQVVIRSNFVTYFCFGVCFSACLSEPVCACRAVTVALPIPRLLEDKCRWKVNSVISTLSMCVRKILTLCSQTGLLPMGVWSVVFRLLRRRSD